MPILMCGVRLRPSGYGATAFVWLAEPKLTLRHLQALAKAGAEERTRTFTVLPPPNGYAAANCCGSCERIVSRSELQPTPATTLFAQIRTQSSPGPRGIMADKEQTMGDKGGKKDKEKSKQQHMKKQKQEAQRKQDKARPKTP